MIFTKSQQFSHKKHNFLLFVKNKLLVSSIILDNLLKQDRLV